MTKSVRLALPSRLYVILALSPRSASLARTRRTNSPLGDIYQRKGKLEPLCVTRKNLTIANGIGANDDLGAALHKFFYFSGSQNFSNTNFIVVTDFLESALKRNPSKFL